MLLVAQSNKNVHLHARHVKDVFPNPRFSMAKSGHYCQLSSRHWEVRLALSGSPESYTARRFFFFLQGQNFYWDEVIKRILNSLLGGIVGDNCIRALQFFDTRRVIWRFLFGAWGKRNNAWKIVLKFCLTIKKNKFLFSSGNIWPFLLDKKHFIFKIAFCISAFFLTA